MLDLESQTTICDCMILATVTSSRQASAIVDMLVKKAKEAPVPLLGTEGMQDREWVLVDFGSILVHIMLPHAREFYQLEKLWQPIANSLQEVRSESQLSA